MTPKRSALVIFVSIVLVVGACGTDAGTGDPVATTGSDAPTTTGADAPTSTVGVPDESTATAVPAGGSGEATLTVGDQVYEFDNYYCRVGSDNTGNENISFSSGAFGEIDGNRAQLDASIYDGSAENRLEGDGVIASVSLNDVADFTNQKVAWVAEGGMQPAPVAFEFDGSTLRVETTFDDARTEELEEVPGVLEAVCGL